MVDTSGSARPQPAAAGADAGPQDEHSAVPAPGALAAAERQDPVFPMVEPAARHDTLLDRREQRDGGIVDVFDIRLQGDNETGFFDV